MTIRSFSAALASLALTSLVAGAAWASPISMNPGTVSLSTGTANFFDPDPTFDITLVSGDTSDNVLDFDIAGPGFQIPLVHGAVAAIVFDDATIVSSSGGSGEPIVVAAAFLGTPLAGAVLFDPLGPSSTLFSLGLSNTPTGATFYSLFGVDLDDIEGADSFDDVLDAIDFQQERVAFEFESNGGGPAVPEPSAALVFGIGMLVSAGAVRRRS